MTDLMPRCPECGSWGVECANDAPVRDRGCARCLRAANARLREEVAVLRWQARDDVHPLRCANLSRHRPLQYRDGGLVCLDCDWRQPIPTVVLDVARAAGGSHE